MTRPALVAEMADAMRKLLADDGDPPIPAEFSVRLWLGMFPEATSAERHAAMSVIEAEVDMRVGRPPGVAVH